jgi:hypothetical protein
MLQTYHSTWCATCLLEQQARSSLFAVHLHLYHPAVCLPAFTVVVQVALKLLNCWESIAGANRDVIKPYVNALLPHVVRDS